MAEEEDDLARIVFRLFLCVVCCFALVWVGFIVSIILLLVSNDTHEIHANCIGLLDFAKVSVSTPLLFPVVFYCFISPLNACNSRETSHKDRISFSFVACIAFFVASVRMIMESSASPRCMKAMGDPPFLLYLLGVKAAMYGVGVLSSMIAYCERHPKVDDTMA
jgi:hypothetical protein